MAILWIAIETPMNGDFAPNAIDLAHEAPFELGGLSVNPSTREVTAGDQRQVLEPRVMQVLVALARRRGTVVSRADLFAACWGGVTVGEESINRCIGALRRVSDAYGGFRIETVARVGYRLTSASATNTVATEPVLGVRPFDKPSIAVLPFADPSGRVEGDYFADGMVDEIVNTLTRFPSLFVIASGSSLSYRERERDFRKIGHELGVRYLLEGSVRRSGPRVRIAAELVEAEGGAIIWSEGFEGTLEDIFALQDEVANAVAARIEPAIQAADLRRGAARPTEDLGAYDLFLRALARHREFDKAGELAAIGLAEQAVGRDPKYAVAWGLVAALRSTTLAFGWTADPEQSARKGKVAIRHALLADADDAPALAMVASATSIIGEDRRAALPMADRALALNPGSYLCWSFAGQVSLNCGQMEPALERFQHALRLNPRGPARCAQLAGVGVALTALQRPEEALPWLNEAVALRPDFPFAHMARTLVLSSLGRIEEGRAALAKFESLASLRNFRDVIDRAGSSEDVLPLLQRLGVDV